MSGADYDGLGTAPPSSPEEDGARVLMSMTRAVPEPEEALEQDLDPTTTQRRRSRTPAGPDDASRRSPEDGGATQSDTRPERSIGNETPTRPTEDRTAALPGGWRNPPSGSEDDGPMVPEGDHSEGSPTKPTAVSPSTGAEEARATAVPPSPSAEAQRLYRAFLGDVAAAEKGGAHHTSKAAMRKAGPGLWADFDRCLALAQQTTSAWIVEQWVTFLDVGRARRARYQQDADASLSADASGNTPDVPAMVATAKVYFEEARACAHGEWQALFRGRRAKVNLARTCDEYAKLDTKAKTDTPGQDASIHQRALFDQVEPEHGCPPEVRDGRWTKFQSSVTEGRRWDILCRELGGFGALLLVDTTNHKSYIERVALPIFTAWVKLIPRVKLTVKEIATRMEGYYDGLDSVEGYCRHLPPLKLESPPSREASPSTRFEPGRGENRPSSTIDPRYLAANPSSDLIHPPSAVLIGYDPLPALFDVLPKRQDGCEHEPDKEARGFDVVRRGQDDDTLLDPSLTDEEMARELDML